MAPSPTPRNPLAAKQLSNPLICMILPKYPWMARFATLVWLTASTFKHPGIISYGNLATRTVSSS